MGPRVVGPGRPLEAVAPLPALARHPCGQVLLEGLDAPVHHGNGVAVLGPLCPAHGFRRQLPVQRGELVAQVCRHHEVPVVPRQLPRGALGGAAHRLGVLVLQRGSTAASRVKTSITTRPYFVFPRVFWLKSMRSACSQSFGPSAADLPSARGRAGPRRPSAPRRRWPASRRGRAASQVGTASVGPAR